MEELIIVKQLPIIEEQLQAIKEDILAQVKQANELVCTEETIKSVKQARADLTKQFNALEEKRKEVKQAVMNPYNTFEATYKTCITDIFKQADKELKGKIDAVENELKAQKRAAVETWFNEYKQAQGVDFVRMDDAGINITLSASVKNLRSQAKDFIDKVAGETQFIKAQAWADEIMVEYMICLNMVDAMNRVNERHAALDRLTKDTGNEASKETGEKEADNVQAVAPAIVEDDKVYRVTFSIKATKTKLIELKKFLKENNYDYE